MEPDSRKSTPAPSYEPPSREYTVDSYRGEEIKVAFPCEAPGVATLKAKPGNAVTATCTGSMLGDIYVVERDDTVASTAVPATKKYGADGTPFTKCMTACDTLP